MTKNIKQIRTVVAAISVVLVAGVLCTVVPNAFANLAGNPTMWTDSENVGQVNNYNYNVAVGTHNLHVALMVDNANSKPLMFLSVTSPAKVVIPCPIVPGQLVVAECNIPVPIPGAWTLTVTAGPLIPPTQPTEYALAAHIT